MLRDWPLFRKKSIRLITNSKYNAHTNPLFKSLSLLKIHDIYILQLYKFIYKLEKKTLPTYFINSMFLRNNEFHNYNTRNADSFRTPLGRHSLTCKSIRFIIPSIYNSIPLCIKDKINTHSLHGFSRYAKNFFISKYTLECTIENCYICSAWLCIWRDRENRSLSCFPSHPIITSFHLTFISQHKLLSIFLATWLASIALSEALGGTLIATGNCLKGASLPWYLNVNVEKNE